MRHALRLTSLAALAVVAAAGCTIPPQPGAPAAPAAEIVPADGRVTMYGTNLDEALRNPEIGGKVRAMFGPDWTGGQLAPTGARPYFVGSTPPRRVRIEGADYIAYTGCLPGDCATRPVVLLIREGGEDIIARLDDGGFSHYYTYGNVGRDAARLIADSGMRALAPSRTS
jgi:hypothetical protein